MNLNLKIRNSMDFKVSLGGFGGSKGGGSNEAKSAIGIEALAGGARFGRYRRCLFTDIVELLAGNECRCKNNCYRHGSTDSTVPANCGSNVPR